MHTHSKTLHIIHSNHNSCYSGKTSHRTMLLLDVTTEVTGTEMTRNGGQRVTQKANYRYSVVGSRNGSDMKKALSAWIALQSLLCRGDRQSPVFHFKPPENLTSVINSTTATISKICNYMKFHLFTKSVCWARFKLVTSYT